MVDRREDRDRRQGGRVGQSLFETSATGLFGDTAGDDSRHRLLARRPSVTENAALERNVGADSVEFMGLYIISVAARLTDMHPQTLRKYERAGLVRPSRTSGSLRLYSARDLTRLRMVRALVDRFGLNLAGVRLVLEIVAHIRDVLDQLEGNAEMLRSSEGRAATAELRGLLRFVGAEQAAARHRG